MAISVEDKLVIQSSVDSTRMASIACRLIDMVAVLEALPEDVWCLYEVIGAARGW